MQKDITVCYQTYTKKVFIQPNWTGYEILKHIADCFAIKAKISLLVGAESTAAEVHVDDLTANNLSSKRRYTVMQKSPNKPFTTTDKRRKKSTSSNFSPDISDLNNNATTSTVIAKTVFNCNICGRLLDIPVECDICDGLSCEGCFSIALMKTCQCPYKCTPVGVGGIPKYRINKGIIRLMENGIKDKLTVPTFAIKKEKTDDAIKKEKTGDNPKQERNVIKRQLDKQICDLTEEDSTTIPPPGIGDDTSSKKQKINHNASGILFIS